MQLILVRHAMPERIDAHPDGSPPADPALTEVGERQAARLVDTLRAEDGAGIVAIYTSPMARARGTAQPLAAALGRQPEVHHDLREYDTGATHYVPVHEMARVDPAGWARIRAGLLPEHVDVEAFRARVVGAVERVVAEHPGRGTAVLVAHAGVVNAYLAHVLGIARPLVFPLDYVGITRVVAGRDGRRVVRTVNEIAHVADLLALR